MLYVADTCQQLVLAVLVALMQPSRYMMLTRATSLYLPYSFAHIQSSRCMTPTHTNARTRSTRVPHADLALHDADTYQTARTALMRYPFTLMQPSRCMILTYANSSYFRYSFARTQLVPALVPTVLVYRHASLVLWRDHHFICGA